MARAQSTLTTGSDAPTRADARAAQKRRRSRILLGLVLLLAVALVAVAGIVFVRAVAADEPEAAPAVTGDCLPTSLTVTADPAVAGALEAIVDDMAGSREDCPAVTIQAEESAVTAAALVAGDAPEFDVWVPDAAMWPARVAGIAALTGAESPELVVGDTVATTPVVFAATEETASAIEGAGFSSFAGGDVSVVLPDPATVSASSAALLALQSAVAGDARVFTATVLGLAAGVVETEGDALAAVSAAETPTVAVTTEQSVLESDEASALVPVYPADVRPAVGMPVVTLADASDETLDAVAALADAVAGGGERLAEHGLRDADGDDPGDSTTTDAGDAAEPVDSANQAETLRTWQVLTAPSRMLSLNDVSGSMSQPATADMTRIDLFEKAAVQAISSLSEDSSIASWVFSSRRIGGQDWQEIVPFGPLSDAEHKRRMIDSANDLDSLVGGGTGLYDSVLAAVTYMRETYVPGQVNLVLLNTDGFNEDDEGLDLAGLLAELEKLHDPASPVAVIAIGYGPDTDQEALEKIAAATDGAAYQALEPTDIGTVLIDAVTQRGCRPYCG